MSKFNKGRNRPNVGDKAREVLEKIDETNPVIILFRGYAKELEDKHDRHERIVKLSRDITIESKRIIFLLHSVTTDIASKRQAVFEEARERLDKLLKTSFNSIALELRNRDGYLYHRAYTAGLQEFVEALCFFEFLKNNSIPNWEDIYAKFDYENEGTFKLLFPQNDFILGIADFTGELMRRCINTLGIGNVSECFKLCDFVKKINTAFLGLSVYGNREFSRKAYVLRQSLGKMELVCYNIRIRGTEVPKHMLLSVLESEERHSDDEGFF